MIDVTAFGHLDNNVTLRFGSYQIPGKAVLGGSDCGEWSDSPAKGRDLLSELKNAQKAFRRQGVKTYINSGGNRRTKSLRIDTESGNVKSYHQNLIPKRGTSTGNVFCSKGWLLVRNPDDFKKGQSIAKSVLKDKRYSMLHDAES